MRCTWAVVGLTIVGWFSVEVAKAVVGRPRPPAVAVQALVSETAADSYPQRPHRVRSRCSFRPRRCRTHRRSPGIEGVGDRRPVVVVVAASRLYLGVVHYLSDVAASVAFAGGSVLIAVGVTAPFMRKPRGSSRRAILCAAVNIVASIVAGLGAAFLGVAISKAIWS